MRMRNITAEEIVDAMRTAFRQARSGDTSASAGQEAINHYWQVADAAGLSKAVAAVIRSQSEAMIVSRAAAV